jgi:hypothetical protein
MRASDPPRLALWLLKRFGCSPNNAAIIGDLDERYRTGRSHVWYWKQAVKAIAVSFAHEVSDHKALAFLALIAGWTLSLAEGLLLISIFRSLNTQALGIAYPNAWRTTLLGLFLAASCLGWITIGWTLKRLFRPHEKPMVLVFAVSVLVAVAVAAVATASFTRRGVSIAHPLIIGLTGNIAGLIFLLIGAGLFRGSGTQDNIRAR